MPGSYPQCNRLRKIFFLHRGALGVALVARRAAKHFRFNFRNITWFSDLPRLLDQNDRFSLPTPILLMLATDAIRDLEAE
jgi:hypothetical protein